MNDKLVMLKQIEAQLDQMGDFDQLQIHVKRHLGNFGNTDYVRMTPYKYTTTDANVNCTTDIFRLVKQIQDAELTGNLGFSITFKKGKADLMQVQDFKKL